MNILFLTPQLPYPPRKGTALRNWGLVSSLAQRHRVSLLSFQALGQPPHPAPELAKVCAAVETVPQPERTIRARLRDMLATRRPDMALRLASKQFGRRLAAWLERESFDVIHIEGIELAPYLDVIERASPRPLIVFDDHNCEYLLQKRTCLTDLRVPARWPGAAYSFVQWRRLLRYEALACRRADRVLAVSEPDADALRELSPGLAVTVVPNGIDVQIYQIPMANDQLTMTKSQIPQSPIPGLVFTGTMDFRPNVDAVLWFARKVLPLVQAEVGDVRFIVVGQRPHSRLDELRGNPAITLTGWVEDTRPYIAEAAVYVAPLRMGGGTRLKLLEAMAMGKPVVATRLGAEGFPVTHGRELLLADTPADFAAAVVELLRTPKQRAALGSAARTFVEERYDWRVITPLVEAVYST